MKRTPTTTLAVLLATLLLALGLPDRANAAPSAGTTPSTTAGLIGPTDPPPPIFAVNAVSVGFSSGQGFAWVKGINWYGLAIFQAMFIDPTYGLGFMKGSCEWATCGGTWNSPGTPTQVGAFFKGAAVTQAQPAPHPVEVLFFVEPGPTPQQYLFSLDIGAMYYTPISTMAMVPGVDGEVLVG